ncbi:Maltodextrin glucosidase [Paramixta manurensis]|uniref:Maltodextrin glucosidase n=1 Tax=Paramixta manurensis TaxID=2740817 RepID=A0A6M8U6Z5_9GAMM|nr:Maltodextrin glucosidase [Erwiniaceae bacterium PD-1]
MRKLSPLALVPLLLFPTLGYSENPAPHWVKSAIFYQIYPPSYQDSNGDGIGDIQGVIQRLDYIKSLGVNTLWFNPLFKSEFKDGGYDISDFYQVDPRYGSNSDLVRLIEEAHRRGLRVCLDLVAGHTSDQNAWFRESAEGKDRRYSDYYIWPDRVPDDVKGKQKDQVGGVIGEDSFVKTDAPRAPWYIKNYYASQPALNYGYAHPNPKHAWEQPVNAPGPMAVRREIENIMAFWMDKGVDGFRVDMASSIVKNDPDKKATISVWQDISSWYHTHYPDAVLISEWSNPKESSAAGFNIDFMMHTGKYNFTSLFFNRVGGEFEPTVSYFAKDGKGEIKTWYDLYREQYQATKGKSYISLPTGNHDIQRLNAGDRNSVDQLKVAMTFFLTMPGTPFIYYGDEIGMRFQTGLWNKEGSQGKPTKNRAGSRTPMQWDEGKNAGFSSTDYWNLYLPIDKNPQRPTVATEEKDPKSLLNYTRQLLKLRASSAALSADGEWRLVSSVTQPYPMVYLRSAGNERYLVALNPSDKPVNVSLPAIKISHASRVVGEAEQGELHIQQDKSDLNLAPISALVFKLE